MDKTKLINLIMDLDIDTFVSLDLQYYGTNGNKKSLTYLECLPDLEED